MDGPLRGRKAFGKWTEDRQACRASKSKALTRRVSGLPAASIAAVLPQAVSLTW